MTKERWGRWEPLFRNRQRYGLEPFVISRAKWRPSTGDGVRVLGFGFGGGFLCFLGRFWARSS